MRKFGDRTKKEKIEQARERKRVTKTPGKPSKILRKVE